MLKSSEMTLIGINKFPNPEKINAEWSAANKFQGMSFLRLETEI
jgi:hypothetical protein